MADKIIENNQVSMMGKIAAGFTFSHQVFGEGFYMTELLVKRLSDSEDRIPVMVSERLVDVTQDYIGEYVEIHGQFRSYNRHEEKHNRLVLSVFSRELKFVEEEDETVPVNQIFLDGYICKPPVYRKTPLGREIADILLAVNRPYGKSDYIPCISWGRNARFALCGFLLRDGHGNALLSAPDGQICTKTGTDFCYNNKRWAQKKQGFGRMGEISSSKRKETNQTVSVCAKCC